MMKNKLIGASLISAATASLCCITPVLALISGTSGIASTFSWTAPFRPFLIGLTILVLGYAWYQKLIPTKENDCECNEDDNPKFMQSKTFSGIITVFSIIMLAFPLYSAFFYPNTEKQIITINKSNIKTIEFKINGMTCTSCENHIDFEINKLSGITNSKTSYKKGNTLIEFDNTKTNEREIEKAIDKTGYKVTSKKEY